MRAGIEDYREVQDFNQGDAMNIYLISQTENKGYDTYDSAVVVAENEDKARCIDPSGHRIVKDGKWHFVFADGTSEPDDYISWANNISKIKVELIGTTEKAEQGIVLTSFNAG